MTEQKKQTFTYVGSGEDSPNVINFMGRQEFVRGEEQEVSDPTVLRKIENNPSFVKGKFGLKGIQEMDKKAKAKADKQRAKDDKTNVAAKKRIAKA